MTKLLLLKMLYGHPFLGRDRASLKCHPYKTRQGALFWGWDPSSEDIAVSNSVKLCYSKLGKNLRTPRIRALGLAL